MAYYSVVQQSDDSTWSDLDDFFAEPPCSCAVCAIALCVSPPSCCHTPLALEKMDAEMNAVGVVLLS